MRHLPPTEEHIDLHLVFFIQKSRDLFQLDLIVAFTDVRLQADLFEVRHMLVPLDAPLLFFLVIFVFAVIHDAANWRFCRRSDLDKVQLMLFGQLQCPLNGDNAQLLGVGANDADFRDPYAFVYTDEF